MTSGMNRNPAYLKRLPKREGSITSKAQLLEAAGEVFSEKGFFATTGKEISERAGCNPAAINYHFGGMENLYAEVLIEAHHRMVSYEEMADIAHAPQSAEEKLKVLFERLIGLSFTPDRISWPLRIFSREMLSSTPYFTILMERELLPKKRLALELVAEYLGTTPENPVASIAMMAFMAPYLALLIGNRQMLNEIAPNLFEEQATQQQMRKQFQAFSFGGLQAIKACLAEK